MSETIILNPQQRLQAALEEFDALNRMLPQGLEPFQIPPTVGIAARLNALLTLLVERGVVDERELMERIQVNEAEQVEQLTAAAREFKRQAMGLVIAQPGQTA